MPQVSLSDEMQTRLLEFKPVVESVVQEQIGFEQHVETVLHLGMNYMLAMIIGGSDQQTLVRSIQLLAIQSPGVVYRFVVEMLKAGVAPLEQEELRRQIDFHPARRTE